MPLRANAVRARRWNQLPGSGASTRSRSSWNTIDAPGIRRERHSVAAVRTHSVDRPALSMLSKALPTASAPSEAAICRSATGWITHRKPSTTMPWRSSSTTERCTVVPAVERTK